MFILLNTQAGLDFPLGGGCKLVTMECFDQKNGDRKLLCRAEGSATGQVWAPLLCKTLYNLEMEERDTLYDPEQCKCVKAPTVYLADLQRAYNNLREKGINVNDIADYLFATRKQLAH